MENDERHAEIVRLWEERCAEFDAFAPAAIDQATRDQERYDAGWNAGVEFAESKQQPLAEAYALVIRDLEPDREDSAVVDALLVMNERLKRMG